MSYAVLICDDDPANRAELREALRGLELLEASEGIAARAIVDAGFVDVIIASRPDMLHYARAMAPDTIRFLISDAALELVVREVNDGVAHRFFQKPYDGAVVRAAIEHAMRTRSQRE